MKSKSAGMTLGACLIVCLSCALVLPFVHTVKADANWGFSMSNLDKTCKSCDDFYQFAMGGWIPTLAWMGPETKKQALAKLEAFNVKIGYPDQWRDYSKFSVTRGSYLADYRNGSEFEQAREIAKIGQPVDRGEWGMTPPTVNAYNNSTMNEIVFPAGILQPPFYNPNADDAVNYGGMGAVIGHEISHGFDDQGSKFDGQGNLRTWWTPEDRKSFDEHGDCIVKQFDSYEVEPGLHQNGKLVLGESIGDLGGLTIAYAA